MATEYIDLTPSWTTVGQIYIRLAESGEQKAIQAMRPEIRRVFAMAEASQIMHDELSDAQKERLQTLYEQAMAKYPD